MLPIVSGSEVSTPLGGTKLDASAFREAAFAPGKLAAAIGQDVGDVFQDLTKKIQDNRNAREIFKADLAMRKTKSDFVAGLEKMPDEKTWLPAWQEQSKSLRDQRLSDPNVNPFVKKQLTQMFDGWEVQGYSEIRTKALQKEVQESFKDVVADATFAAHLGHLDDAKNILKAGVENHVIGPLQAKTVATQFPSIAAQAQADTAISTNPIKAPDLIKRFQGIIEPRIFVGVQARAQEAKNRAQSDNLKDLAQQMDNSPDGTIDPRVLAAKVKAGSITQKMADGLNSRMKKNKTEQAKDDFDVGMMNADDHNWTDDKTPQETARKMREDGAHLPPALRDRFFNHIDAKINAAKKEGESGERPIERDIFAAMKNDPINLETRHIKALTRKDSQGDYLVSDAELKKKYPGQSRDSLVRAEQVNQAQKRDKMRAWFNAPANKDATEEEAEAYRQKLNQPDIQRAVRDAIHSAPALPVETPEHPEEE